MSKQSSPMLHIKKEAAAFRLRQLLDELGMLVGSFPDLREAFDPRRITPRVHPEERLANGTGREATQADAGEVKCNEPGDASTGR